MGILNKIKDILFEEEPDIKEEVSSISNDAKPIAEKIEPQKVDTPVQKAKEEPLDQVSERELFKPDNSFTFPDFNEEEFSNMTRTKPKPTTNILEYERKKKMEKRYDYGKYERVEKTEVVEKKKFKPSPIISPVYGILNEDYKPEDIKNKNEVSGSLDINSVRKKAFGEEVNEPKTSYYEETVTVKLKEDEEEKKQRVKTIDELLEDTSDVTINVSNNEEVYEPKISYDKVDEDLEDLVKDEVVEEVKKNDYEEEEDTLESDLFDLIDSMYDNREDGDI